MKTSSSTFGWILLGLCLCLSPAVTFAQERSSRGHSIALGRKPDAHLATSRPIPRSGWFSSRRTPPPEKPQAATSSTRVTRISSPYGTATAATRTIREIEPPISELGKTRVSFLPDGRVVTYQTTYVPAPTMVDDTVLNTLDPQPDLTTPTLQFPNSAMAPPPPPVSNASLSTRDIPKQDLSTVLRAERISPDIVKSPYPPHFLLNVEGLRSGSLAQDPSSKKLFRVP